jgi:hypothetical protein
MQESSITMLPLAKIVPYEPETCVFLRMLQRLISHFASPLLHQMQLYSEALLSANVQYDNKDAKEFESGKGPQRIPEKHLHLFMDVLTESKKIFP